MIEVPVFDAFQTVETGEAPQVIAIFRKLPSSCPPIDFFA
jgi:hypothetical protein